MSKTTSFEEKYEVNINICFLILNIASPLSLNAINFATIAH